jgi:hypothetical protein
VHMLCFEAGDLVCRKDGISINVNVITHKY